MNYSYNHSDFGLVLHCYFSDDIIIFILLIAGVCVGLPALVWALYALHNYRKNGGGISAFIVLLLLNDLLELLLSLFIVSYLFFDDSKTFSLQIPWPVYRNWYYYDYAAQIPCPKHRYRYRNNVNFVVDLLWTMFKIDGLYLHQLVALQSILSLKNQTSFAQVFSPPCSIILYIILSLVVFGCQFVDYRHFLNLALCLFPFCILGVTCLLAYKVPDRVPHTGRKPRSAVLIVSTVTLFAFSSAFITVLVFAFLRHSYRRIYDRRPMTINYMKFMTINYMKFMTIYDRMFAFLVSVRVFSDPLLCVLVCKEKLRDQKQQTDAELNTDLQSV